MDDTAAKPYDLEAIVASIRTAGNPRKAAMDAVADTEGLEDAQLLEALGAKRWADVPTTPYWTQPAGTVPPQMAPRKRPGPKPGSRRKQNAPKPAAARKEDPKEAPKEAGDKPSGPSPVEAVKAVQKAIESGLDGINVYMENWMDVLTRDGVFSGEQVRMLALCLEKSAAYLSGMNAAIRMMEEQEEKKDAGHQD